MVSLFLHLTSNCISWHLNQTLQRHSKTFSLIICSDHFLSSSSTVFMFHNKVHVFSLWVKNNSPLKAAAVLHFILLWDSSTFEPDSWSLIGPLLSVFYKHTVHHLDAATRLSELWLDGWIGLVLQSDGQTVIWITQLPLIDHPSGVSFKMTHFLLKQTKTLYLCCRAALRSCLETKRCCMRKIRWFQNEHQHFLTFLSKVCRHQKNNSSFNHDHHLSLTLIKGFLYWTLNKL